MQILLRCIIANLAISFCILTGSILPGMWEGISSRDFRPQAVITSVFIFMVALLLKYKYRWSVTEMLISLIPTQVIILLSISYFTGYVWIDLFNSVNLTWLMYIDLFICTPWILGIIISSIVLKINKKNI
jgi:hypothetical protein